MATAHQPTMTVMGQGLEMVHRTPHHLLLSYLGNTEEHVWDVGP